MTTSSSDGWITCQPSFSAHQLAWADTSSQSTTVEHHRMAMRVVYRTGNGSRTRLVRARFRWDRLSA
jgi:hypothetical protein